MKITIECDTDAEMQDLKNIITVRSDDTKFYYATNGYLHREDGPAIEFSNGRKDWYFEGKRHRTDGPAIDDNGDFEYWQNGIIHRDDGPAAIFRDGEQQWYKNGIQYDNKGDK